jgi:cytosine/adenosine deaminase-related metal-dependent hydrolase
MKYFDLKALILEKIKRNGGWVNTHAHLDRAFSLNKNNYKFINATLQEKWSLNDSLKRKSTVNDIYDRMAYALENMINQNVQAIGTYIDVDEVIKDKAIKAAIKIKEKFHNAIKIKYMNQSHQGVVNKKAYFWFKKGAEFVDILGGLPAADKDKAEKHMEIVLQTAKDLKKLVHIHVDQNNSDKERETELLAKKTLKAKMENRVTAVHSISLAAHKKNYRQKIYQLIKKAGLNIIVCPTAWIDSRRQEKLSPTHNAVTPIDELIPARITVALGTDNIVDIYKPFSDGDIWTELRFLLESCHFYEVDELVKIATVNGLKVLGLN